MALKLTAKKKQGSTQNGGFELQIKPLREKIFQGLQNLYPDAGTELIFKNEFELVVSVILSAQCTDKKVNQVTPELFKKYSNFQLLSKAKLDAVENIIRPINYYRTKAKHLLEMASQVVEEFNATLPRTHESLISLSGVGNKTANVVLSELGAAHALAVDTHVFRVARRLGIAVGNNVVQIEHSLKENFPPEKWRTLHHTLILHGRRVCKAQRPLCENCPLSKQCPYFKTEIAPLVKQ